MLGAVVLDRDFRSDEEVDALTSDLSSQFVFARSLARKEIENYVLVPSVLDRAIQKAVRRQARRSKSC